MSFLSDSYYHLRVQNIVVDAMRLMRFLIERERRGGFIINFLRKGNSGNVTLKERNPYCFGLEI
jgi:hypothetical protein